MAPLCPPMKEVDTFKFVRVFEGTKFCTYVCEHKHTIAASQAIVSCSIKNVSTIADLSGAPINPIFRPLDFDCVTTGRVVPLSLLDELILNEDLQRSEIKELAHSMALALDREIGRNDITEQILAAKLGAEFSISRKPMTKRKAQNFSQYSKSRQDLCIQHIDNAFKNDEVVAGHITSSDSTFVESSLDISTSPMLEEGDVITGVIEFKKATFAVDQTLAEMLCTLTDCALEQLKQGRQLKKAIVYGLAINYTSRKTEVFKMVLDFMSKSCDVQKLKDEVTMCEGINFMVSALKNIV